VVIAPHDYPFAAWMVGSPRRHEKENEAAPPVAERSSLIIGILDEVIKELHTEQLAQLRQRIEPKVGGTACDFIGDALGYDPGINQILGRHSTLFHLFWYS